MTDIIKLLQENKGVDDFRVSSTKRESYELFFVHQKLETVRSTDTLDISVTVYVNHDGKLGSSTFAVYDSMSDEEATAKIETAAQRARLVSNEPWELPAGTAQVEQPYELPSNFKNYAPQELAKKIADAVFAADDLEGGSINALEIFLYEDVIRVANSRGVDKTQKKRHCMVEAIPTWNENGESVELYENYTFTEFDPAVVTAEIAGKMREVRDRQHAEKPETPLRCNVVLRGKEIMRLAAVLARDLNYSSVYSHSNLHKKGDDLQPGNAGDKLSVTMCGKLTGSTRSAFFDEDGVDLAEQPLIVDGVVVGGFGADRFAQYLGEKATGNLGCVSVKCGTMDDESENGPYLECISLSGLQLNLYNDYIGGEIRLAYYHDGEKIRPVTSISMSAKLSEVLSTLRLSREPVSIDGYHGPAKALLKDVSIL